MWGLSPRKDIEIPCLIDDYNHWMLGVDKSDQLIAYYRPELRCRRFWMPIMFHCLDVIRINCYIIFKNLSSQDIGHKKFLVGFIEALIGRAASIQYGVTRAAKAASHLFSPPRKKRRRMRASIPQLPAERFNSRRKDHIVGMNAERKQRACCYCAYLRALDKKLNMEHPHVVRNVIRICVGCNVHLCNDHFDLYHFRNSTQV